MFFPFLFSFLIKCCLFVSFRQAQSSVLIGLHKLEELGVPLQRPDDYFAEMIKTDDHMKKVRQSLLNRQKILEQKEKARKMRILKKYGKKVRFFIMLIQIAVIID